MKRFIKLYKALLLIAICGAVHAQPTVNSISPSSAVNALVGTGVTISGISFSGSSAQLAQFTGGAGEIGIGDGIALTTGDYSFITGNNTSNVGDQASISSTGLHDADLAALAGTGTGATKNPVILEFDFTTTGTTVQFEYVFACEEYNRYAPNGINGCGLSDYNDVFGFFISGPGISGPFTNSAINIATLPSSTTPVSVNTVNYCFNSGYYVNNCYGPTPCAGTTSTTSDPNHLPFPYNGKTVVMLAKTTVSCEPGSVYHIKMGVTNISDDLLDAAVFIKANSLKSNFVIGEIAAAPAVVCEGDDLTLSITGNSGWDYEWSDGQNGLGLNTINTTTTPTSTNYTVTVTNPDGCQLTEDIDIVIHPHANVPPYVNGINNSGEYDLYIQAGDEACFNIPTFDSPIENTTITYLGGISGMNVGPPSGSPHKIGYYCWDTETEDVGDHTFQIQVCDENACNDTCVIYEFRIHVACKFCPVDVFYENRSTSTTPLPPLTKVARYIYAGTSVDPSQTDGAVIVSSGETVDFRAGLNIFLEPGFDALPGSNFTAYIEPGTCVEECEECCSDWNGFTMDEVPNVFTPNGDGVNDIWYIGDVNHPYCAFNAQEFELVIFNRWGNEVYRQTETSDMNYEPFTCCPFKAPSPDNPIGYSSIFWNGTNSGDHTADGPYYWTLTLRGCGNEQGYNGFIHIFKNMTVTQSPTQSQVEGAESMLFPSQPEYLANEPLEDITVSLIPNPAQNIFSIAGVTNGASILFDKVEVLNGYGEALLQLSNYAAGQSINIQSFSRGTYWIKMTYNGNTYVKPLIKQ